MRISKLYLLLILSATLSAQTQTRQITLTVISPGLNETTNVFVSGNNNQFGNWDPGKVPLAKVNDSTWTRKFVFDKGKLLEFKFTQGLWQNEALNDGKEIPRNEIVKLFRDTTIIKKIKYWKSNLSPIMNFHGQITGTVEYFKKLNGKGILPRDVIVWLPPDYNKNKARHYPVLYMNDGQNIFDPATSSFGVDWQIDETADSLIRKNIILPMIIVGIYNTTDRNLDYSPGEKGQAYLEFIVNKVKPLVDSKFRTKPGRRYTTIGGSSMGGLISFMLVWNYNSIFSKAICMSPAFKIDSFDYVKTVEMDKSNKDNISIYIDNGGVGLEERLQPGIDEMLKVLVNKGFKYNKNLFWVKDLNATHNEAAWAKRMRRTLKIFFGN